MTIAYRPSMPTAEALRWAERGLLTVAEEDLAGFTRRIVNHAKIEVCQDLQSQPAVTTGRFHHRSITK